MDAYPEEEVDEAFRIADKVPVSVAFGLFFGLSFLCFLGGLAVVAAGNFLGVFGYLIALALGLLLGYYLYRVNKGRLKVVLGVFAPGLGLILIFGLKILKRISEQFSNFQGGEMGYAQMFIGNDIPDGLLIGVLFYLCVNIFVIIGLIRKKEHKAFLYYLLAPVFFVMLWLVFGMFSGLMLFSV